jgi:dipeptidyl aminopeptidase/acylaminoacyl peptidase
LLKHGVQPATEWNTTAGSTILNSLTWSSDGSKLAFVADPSGSAQTGLYIYTVSTNKLQTVALPTTGTISHLIWSPDSIRIAFEVAALNGNSALLDYNTQSGGVLTLQTSADAQANAADTVLALQWSPDGNAPALTWSLGQSGQVHTIWLQRVGIGGTTQPTLLASGNFTQAEYSPKAHSGVGGWLLVSNGDITSVDLAALITTLTTGKQVQMAQWSPDGNTVAYFAALSNGIGMFHVLNTLTGTDTLLTAKAVATPLPAWSADSQHIAYSTGTAVMIVDVRTPGTAQPLKQQGRAVALSWSSSSPAQLVLALGDDKQGLYLVDTQHATAVQLDKEELQGAILWTQIP